MRLVALLPLTVTLVACVPALDAETWRIASPRVLAVRADPAEAAPGKSVALQALVVTPGGEVGNAPLAWAACTARTPLAEQAPVAVTCLTDEGDHIVPIADGAGATWKVPNDVCAQFGPNPPTSANGESAGRPADPDGTGGWYAPIRLTGPTAHSDTDFFRVRLRCPLAGTTQQQAAEFQQSYRTNAPPAVEHLYVQRSGAAELPVAATDVLAVHPGETLTWRVAWADCGDHAVCGDGHCDVDERLSLAKPDPALLACKEDCQKPLGCGGAERYVRFDLATRTLVIQREAISASFYTTAGNLTDAVGGRTADDPAITLATTWTAPAAAGTAHFWVVLRDDRGGVGWQHWQVTVQP